VNVEGTRRVLEAFENAQPFVYVSTSSVYDAGHGGRLTEDAPTGHKALTAYARTKIEGERLVAASGRRSIILRPHIVYGPGDTTLLPRLLAARRRGWLPVPGNGANRVSVTHVLNLSHAVERSLLSAGAEGVFNIADAESPSVDELLQTTFGRLGLKTRLLHIPRPVAWAAAWAGESLARQLRVRREPLLTRYVVASLADDHLLDISRARESLGYAPQSTFRDPWPDDQQDSGPAVQNAMVD
jgi:nucleoside-diphosphate-sugar epimerase